MAGRPLTRARKFGGWEDRLWGLLVELSYLMPPSSLAKQRPEGRPNYWVDTFRLLERATIAASVVRYLLEDKAGLDAEALQAEREQARGLRGEEAADRAAADGQGGET